MLWNVKSAAKILFFITTNMLSFVFLASLFSFSFCNIQVFSTDGQCGPSGLYDIICNEPFCCSKLGWCGMGDPWCGEGCQPNYGSCQSAHVPTVDGSCGVQNSISVSCLPGACCSKWGWCGFLDAWCGDGCQSAFGDCKSLHFGYWPNSISSANSDLWLSTNHLQIVEVKPNVLVVNFANPTLNTNSAEDLINKLISGFSMGSTFHNSGSPQWNYQISKFVNLRDGDPGFPLPPAGYPYQNSQQYPRRDPNVNAYWRFDYGALFNATYASLYGYVDTVNGGFIDLATLFKEGIINEMWVIGSGDVPDVSAAEVLEYKQTYDENNNKIEGSFTPCAGNGCFDAVDIPAISAAGVSIRIGWVNYNRGPGCYMHSNGHAIEGAAANTDAVPYWGKWFKTYAAFDLDTRYNLLFSNEYALPCQFSICLDHPTETEAIFYTTPIVTVDPIDFVCGNVHFPPNGVSHYDYERFNETVLSSCENYGQGGILTEVNANLWQAFSDYSDCGGDYLTWWYYNMPWYGSNMKFDDGGAMYSPGPFMFY